MESYQALNVFSWSLLVAMVAFAMGFYRIQNQKSKEARWVGGPISWPKSFWLSYAIFSWFLAPIGFLFFVPMPPILQWTLWIHLASWWIRGPLELVMIYRWFNWTPVYGISHDVTHCVVLCFLSMASAAEIGLVGFQENPNLLLVLIYLGVIQFSLIVEALFAALFLKTRGGDSLIYFASDSKEFQSINRFTQVVCVLVYGHWVAQSLWLLTQS